MVDLNPLVAEEHTGGAGEDPSETSLRYGGRIVRYSPGRGVGAIRSDAGREIAFDIRFCEVAGVGRGERAREVLTEGQRVGFDVGWTSRGLRVTWMSLAHDASEGQSGAEGEVSPEEAADENGEGRDVE